MINEIIVSFKSGIQSPWLLRPFQLLCWDPENGIEGRKNRDLRTELFDHRGFEARRKDGDVAVLEAWRHHQRMRRGDVIVAGPRNGQ